MKKFILIFSFFQSIIYRNIITRMFRKIKSVSQQLRKMSSNSAKATTALISNKLDLARRHQQIPGSGFTASTISKIQDQQIPGPETLLATSTLSKIQAADLKFQTDIAGISNLVYDSEYLKTMVASRIIIPQLLLISKTGCEPCNRVKPLYILLQKKYPGLHYLNLQHFAHASSSSPIRVIQEMFGYKITKAPHLLVIGNSGKLIAEQSVNTNTITSAIESYYPKSSTSTKDVSL